MAKIQFHFKPEAIRQILSNNPTMPADFTGPTFESAGLDIADNGFFMVTTTDKISGDPVIYMYNPADVARIKLSEK